MSYLRPVTANLFKWATVTTSFSAGSDPWSGQPTKVAPVTDVFGPEQPFAAEYVNYLLNRLAEQDAALWNIIGSYSALNWTQCTLPLNGIVGACFDQKYNRWVNIETDGSGNNQLYNTYDGTVFTSIGSPLALGGSNPAYGLMTNGVDGHLYTCANSIATIHRFSHSASTWGNAVTGAGNAPAFTKPVASLYTTPGALGGNFVFAGVATGAFELWFVNDAGTSASKITTLPTEITTATCMGRMAASPTLAILVLNHAITGSGVGFKYATSTNQGVAWTNRSFSGALVTNGHTIKDIAYSSEDGLFVMLVQNTSSGASWLVTSPDGITWTYTTVIGSPLTDFSLTGEPSGIACLGSQWAISTTSTTSTMNPLLVSLDQGLTVQRAEAFLGVDTTSTASTAYFRGQVVASSTRFFASNGTHRTMSAAMGRAVSAV